MRAIDVPDYGDSGSLHQTIQVPGPDDPGYTGHRLPDGDPWAAKWNAALDDMEREADIDSEPPASAADWLEMAPEDRHPDGFEPRAWERQGATADTAELHLDDTEFPEAYQGAGPMFAAVPLGDPWYQLACRGATSYIPESGLPGAPEPECAFLDRDQAEVVADASTFGELSCNQGLVGWNDVTAARAESDRQAEAEAWGGREPSGSYAEWLAEGEAEAGA
jgi:hypothetical protein